MVVGLITSLGVGLLLAVLGVLLCRGQLIALIAEHCRLNVKEENYGPYTRLVGLALILMGLGICVGGVVVFAVKLLKGLIWIGLGLAAGLALLALAQGRYNKG